MLTMYDVCREVLIEKHWRGKTSRSVCDFFWNEVNQYDNKMVRASPCIHRTEMKFMCFLLQDTPPIISSAQHFLINVYRENIFLLAVVVRETPPLLVIEFLHRVYEIFEEYFDSMDENTIKDNFSMIYQLLEEMMDYGYPLTTEPNALKVMIQPPSILNRLTSVTIGGSMISDVLPDGTISNMPWRKTDVKYTQNEIYVDIVEEIDAILSREGNILTSEVNGIIQSNSRLSGVPDLTLTFVDPSVIDDCSFHPCVRYNRWEKDQLISFVPPDGPFELMRYRVNHGQTQKRLSSSSSPFFAQSNIVGVPCYCQSQFNFDQKHISQASVTITTGIRPQHSLLLPNNAAPSSVVLEDVTIIIPFTKLVRTTDLKVSVGSIIFDEATKVNDFLFPHICILICLFDTYLRVCSGQIARWTVGKLSQENFPQLTGTILLQPSSSSLPKNSSGNSLSTGAGSTSATMIEEFSESTVAPVIEMQWKVPMATVSGLSVASLQLSNEKYKPYKGVRTVTRSGKFLIRSI
jgi:AP-3 complex subunit mu